MATVLVLDSAAKPLSQAFQVIIAGQSFLAATMNFTCAFHLVINVCMQCSSRCPHHEILPVRLLTHHEGVQLAYWVQLLRRPATLAIP